MNNAKRALPSKHELALIDLLEAGTTGISKLTELPSYGETALPTTISELGRDRGLIIHRERRPHTHRHGGKTSFTWYWLADQRQAKKAVHLVAHLSAMPPEQVRENYQRYIAAFPAVATGESAND
ncbi:hypothetical protein [Simiduia aestuariiviva]|uniref:Uncharacterized protein n=1 Tax=Simiduia aestuariiviva TaxID=1510459 RepID=A0A839UQV2_9GAMM|nr:hypothetical protein [Simiduia aestuariiviva]MBB3170163.1 hypothetical protein [Simiduia aestuariiviva]